MKKFVLLDKKTGKPLTLYVKANPSDADFCGDTAATFSTCEGYPVFAVDTLEAAQEARSSTRRGTIPASSTPVTTRST